MTSLPCPALSLASNAMQAIRPLQGELSKVASLTLHTAYCNHMYYCLCSVLCKTSSNVLTKVLVVHRSPHLTKQRVSAESKRSGNYGIEDRRKERNERKSSILLHSIFHQLHPLPLQYCTALHCTALHCMLHAKHFYWSILASYNITQCHVMSCHTHMLPTRNRLINHIIATV